MLLPAYLDSKEAPATYWRIPCANHYLQVDEPELIANILRVTLADKEVPAEIDGELCTAVKVQLNY